MKVVLVAAFCTLMVNCILGMHCLVCDRVEVNGEMICDPKPGAHFTIDCTQDDGELVKFCFTRFGNKNTPKERHCAPDSFFKGIRLKNGCREVTSEKFEKTPQKYCFCNTEKCNNHTKYE